MRAKIVRLLIRCEKVWDLFSHIITHNIIVVPLRLAGYIFPKKRKVFCRYIERCACLSVVYNPFSFLLDKFPFGVRKRR